MATLAGNGVVLKGTRVEDATANGRAPAGSNWAVVISDHNLPPSPLEAHCSRCARANSTCPFWSFPAIPPRWPSCWAM